MNMYEQISKDIDEAKEQAKKDFKAGNYNGSMPNDDDTQNIEYDKEMKRLINENVLP